MNRKTLSSTILSKEARLNAEFTKNLAKILSDPIRYYEGPTKPDEDFADSFKTVKGIRLG